MIRLNVLVFFTILQLLVVAVALWVVWFFKSRALARQLAASLTKPSEPKAEANAAAYFAAELLTTQSHMAALAEDDPQGAAALAFRSAYLDLERDFAQGKARDPAFWTMAQQRLALLQAPAPTAAAEPQAQGEEEVVYQQTDEEDTARVKRLFDAQNATINELKEALAALAGDRPEGQEILNQFDRISRTNREMAMCVSILEDDNTFLRDQISELLKTP